MVSPTVTDTPARIAPVAELHRVNGDMIADI
jgi:hypothetical protein